MHKGNIHLLNTYTHNPHKLQPILTLYNAFLWNKKRQLGRVKIRVKFIYCRIDLNKSLLSLEIYKNLGLLLQAKINSEAFDLFINFLVDNYSWNCK